MSVVTDTERLEAVIARAEALASRLDALIARADERADELANTQRTAGEQ